MTRSSRTTRSPARPTPFRGSSGTSRALASTASPTSWCSPPRPSRTAPPTVVSTGSRSATAPPGRPTCSTPPAPRTTSARASRPLGQERACSLNKDATVDAEDPSVAAGTLTPGGTTVPWVAWSENVGATPRDLRLAPRRRRPLRAVQLGPADLEHAERRDTARHHVLGQHAVHQLAGERRRAEPHLHRALRGWRNRSRLQARHPDGHRPPRSGHGRPATADLVDLHRKPVERRRRRVPGWSRRHAVLPVRRRHRPGAAVRAGLRAQRHRDRHVLGRHRQWRHRRGLGQPGRRPHQGALRLRDDDRLRRSHAGPGDRGRHGGHGVRRRARRAPREHGDPLPRRRVRATSGRSSVPTRPSRR